MQTEEFGLPLIDDARGFMRTGENNANGYHINPRSASSKAVVLASPPGLTESHCPG